MIGHDHIGDGQPLGATRLYIYPSARILFRPAFGKKAIYPDSVLTVDDETTPEISKAMIEERDLNGYRIRNSLNTALDHAENVGMSDLLESLQLFGVGKHDSRQLGAIDPISRQHVGPPSGHLSECWSAFSKDLVTNGVGVYGEEAKLVEDASNRGLSAPDSPAHNQSTLVLAHPSRR